MSAQSFKTPWSSFGSSLPGVHLRAIIRTPCHSGPVGHWLPVMSAHETIAKETKSSLPPPHPTSSAGTNSANAIPTLDAAGTSKPKPLTSLPFQRRGGYDSSTKFTDNDY